MHMVGIVMNKHVHDVISVKTLKNDNNEQKISFSFKYFIYLKGDESCRTSYPHMMHSLCDHKN